MAQVVRRSLLVPEVFKSRADQISHTLPMIRHRCNFWSVVPGAKSRRRAPLTRDTRKGIKRV